MSKERMVTRKIIESKKYNVYKVNGTSLELLEVIETKGRPSERELENKHNVDKVVCTLIDEKKAIYGCTTSKFMEFADFLGYEDSSENDVDIENENKEGVQ